MTTFTDPEDEVGRPREYVLEHHLPLLARALEATRRAIIALVPPAPDEPRPRGVVLGEPAGWCWPMPPAPDGRHPSISDGVHTAAELRAWKAYKAARAAGKPWSGPIPPRTIRVHRGVDIMYWRPMAARVGKPRHPWQSTGYEVIEGTMALAAGPGVVNAVRQLRTGWAVGIDHGGGVETAYHHLYGACVQRGQSVRAGQPVGLVGGSPVGYQLVHLHFDLLQGGRYIDPAPHLKRWRVADYPLDR